VATGDEANGSSASSSPLFLPTRINGAKMPLAGSL